MELLAGTTTQGDLNRNGYWLTSPKEQRKSIE
jgi:hypothetical protein